MPLPGMTGGMWAVLQFPRSSSSYPNLYAVLYAVILLPWLGLVEAMRPGRMAELRRETVDMFYHGFDNYMRIAFPEDEV